MSNANTTERRQPAPIRKAAVGGSPTILENKVLRMWKVSHPEGGEAWDYLDVTAERWPNDEAHVYVMAANEPVILGLKPAEACELAAGIIHAAVAATTMNRLRLPDDEPTHDPQPAREAKQRPADWHPETCDPTRCEPGRHFSRVDDYDSDVDDIRVEVGISQYHEPGDIALPPDVSVTIENTAFTDTKVRGQFTPDNLRHLAVMFLEWAAAAEAHACRE